MDTSKQYIEMCDCSEIQNGRQHEPLDFWQYSPDSKYVDHWSQVWLPRQDQLQTMVDNDFDGFVWYVDGCYGTGVDEFSVDNKELPSMEQLWLKFVMGEKYNKFWDDVWVDRV